LSKTRALLHRPDIDGLRAVAVAPIVLFHAGLSSMSGGFTGVDIFFVISGFLITSIIVREQDAGSFSIAGFYRRRVVRIFPALFVMLAATLVAGCVLLLPADVRSLALSAAAATAFVSNIWFDHTSGYFGAAAETVPLIHTWSLGVEEQFYLFHPLLLIAIRRFSRNHLRSALAIVGVVSFAASLWLAIRSPDAAFYLLPSRAWELSLGALVAVGAFPIFSRKVGDALAALGLGLIVAGLFLIRPGAAFPAPWALFPCGGAALLIAYGQGARTERLMSAAPMRALGAISYSLYLWHWPIISLYRLHTDQPLTFVTGALAVVVALVLAWASYALIEQPFLRKFRDRSPRPVLIAGGAALVAMLGASALVHARADFWRDLPTDVQRVASYVDYQSWPDHKAQFLDGTCFVSLGETYDRANCLKISATKRNMLVFGDSHAAQYWKALELRFPGWNVMQATGAACRPMHGVSTEAHCNELMPYILDDFLVRGKIDAVVLGGRWLDGETDKLEATIRTLMARGIDVTVIGPAMEYSGEFPRLLASAMLRGDADGLGRLRVADRKPLDAEIGRMVGRTGARYLSEIDIECPGGRCNLFDPDGGPFHFDYGHMTLSAARSVVAHMPEP
jgi:peptidoglycan/LPS O-acetylase OafA/YrhL